MRVVETAAGAVGCSRGDRRKISAFFVKQAESPIPSLRQDTDRARRASGEERLIKAEMRDRKFGYPGAGPDEARCK
ncbi:hypothetical protein AAFF_G00190970 [Aldrovandia affinis]|uniref:Uncharacterized protein n=1 Tax=Aldrovandia affinis TaxID=143900 RepID=A0AAD7RJJ3_9TELE|nr:hypothetical protein AAFF_G00190970 [Aldrovandia affinis]